MDLRKLDILILFGLVLAVGAASDVARHYPEYWAWALFVLIVVFAYSLGLRRGMKRRQN